MAMAELKKYTSSQDPDEAPRLREAAVLSTCNRFEVYAINAAADDGQDKFAPVEDYLSGLQGVPIEALRENFYRMDEPESVGHLMRVATGVDSMVVGEPQILGQVNESFREAQAASIVGTVLTQVFSRALRVGKRARTETDIGRYTTSVSHAAVDVAETKMGDLSDRHIAVVGAGDMAELAAHALVAHGAREIAIVNRTHARSVALAEQINARPMSWADLEDVLVWADIVITATDAPHVLIYKAELELVIDKREGRELLFMDIAMPRNVDPSVCELTNVRVHDIDELKSVVSEGLEHRKAAIPQVEAIVEEEVLGYYNWLKSRDVAPVIVDLRDRIEKLVSSEVEDALRHFGDPKDREVVERLRHRVTNKILHQPSAKLKTYAANGNGMLYADAIRELFALDQPADDQ
jgi:glutamyl-tRNA reductase